MSDWPVCASDDASKCQFSPGVSTRTDMYFSPSYDREGNNLNPDGNHLTETLTCTACNVSWYRSSRPGLGEIGDWQVTYRPS